MLSRRLGPQSNQVNVNLEKKMKFAAFSGVLSTVVLMASAGMASAEIAASATCAPVTNEAVTGLFDKWNKSLATLKPDEVAKNYAPDAVLLPTVSNKPRTTTAEITAYFVDFLKKEPQGVIDTRTVRLGCNTASDVGTYTFSLKTAEGKVKKVHARYSFIYELVGNEWKIVHHHSSAMPEVVSQ